MTIIQLEYLLAVANCGSFSLAAEHCFVTQPSLSMQVNALEEELGVVLPSSFYEKAGTQLFNSIAVLDADGTLLGVYRKTHIPDDHYYQEKFYFTPGDTGIKEWATRYGRIGIGICWDQ